MAGAGQTQMPVQGLAGEVSVHLREVKERVSFFLEDLEVLYWSRAELRNQKTNLPLGRTVVLRTIPATRGLR